MSSFAGRYQEEIVLSSLTIQKHPGEPALSRGSRDAQWFKRLNQYCATDSPYHLLNCQAKSLR